MLRQSCVNTGEKWPNSAILMTGKEEENRDQRKSNNKLWETNKALSALSIYSIFTHDSKQPPTLAQKPKVKTFLLKLTHQNKRATLQKRGQRRKKSIPIMLVQALQYQNAACERRTAGRHTKSIALGLWFCVVSERGQGCLPPTASWKQHRHLTTNTWTSLL